MQRTRKRSNKTRSRLPPHNAETGALCRRHCPGIRWHHHEGRAGGWKCVFSSVTNPSNPPGTFTEKCSHTVTLCVPWPGGCYSSLDDWTRPVQGEEVQSWLAAGRDVPSEARKPRFTPHRLPDSSQTGCSQSDGLPPIPPESHLALSCHGSHGVVLRLAAQLRLGSC